jgi:hypothetical protein
MEKFLLHIQQCRAIYIYMIIYMYISLKMVNSFLCELYEAEIAVRRTTYVPVAIAKFFLWFSIRNAEEWTHFMP